MPTAPNTPRPGVAADYLWNVIDREKKIDHKLGSQAMFRAGMLYNFYSMAHALSRPAGRFSLSALKAPQGRIAGQTCSWYLLQADAQPASRICWSTAAGIPLAMDGPGASPGAWQRSFEVQTLDRNPIPPATFAVDTTGLSRAQYGRDAGGGLGGSSGPQPRPAPSPHLSRKIFIPLGLGSDPHPFDHETKGVDPITTHRRIKGKGGCAC